MRSHSEYLRVAEITSGFSCNHFAVEKGSQKYWKIVQIQQQQQMLAGSSSNLFGVQEIPRRGAQDWRDARCFSGCGFLRVESQKGSLDSIPQ